VPNGIPNSYDVYVTSTGTDPDTVTIDQNDAGNLTVTADGQQKLAFPSMLIRRVVVNMGDGSDAVEYRTQGRPVTTVKEVLIDLGEGQNTFDIDTFGPAEGKVYGYLYLGVTGGSGGDDLVGNLGGVAGGSQVLYADLGAGDDDAYLDVQGAVTEGGYQKVELNGGAGGDNLRMAAYFAGSSGYGIYVGAGSTLDLKVNGGAGRDTLNAWYEGEADGAVNLKVDGYVNSDVKSPVGPGPLIIMEDDDLKVRASLKVYSGSTGAVTGKALGGIGDDKLEFKLTDLSNGAAAVTARLDGGSGDDVLLSPVSPGVIVTNV
jgi:hypothetical protein